MAEGGTGPSQVAGVCSECTTVLGPDAELCPNCRDERIRPRMEGFQNGWVNFDHESFKSDEGSESFEFIDKSHYDALDQSPNTGQLDLGSENSVTADGSTENLKSAKAGAKESEDESLFKELTNTRAEGTLSTGPELKMETEQNSQMTKVLWVSEDAGDPSSSSFVKTQRHEEQHTPDVFGEINNETGSSSSFGPEQISNKGEELQSALCEKKVQERRNKHQPPIFGGQKEMLSYADVTRSASGGILEATKSGNAGTKTQMLTRSQAKFKDNKDVSRSSVNAIGQSCNCATHKELSLTFSILLPPDLMKGLEKKEWDLVLGTSIGRYGPFGKSELVLSCVNTYDDNFALYARSVDLLSCDFPLDYKYFIRINGQVRGDDWEFFHFSSRKPGDNRILHKPPKQEIQFDMYFERKEPQFEGHHRPEWAGGKTPEEKLWSRMQRYHDRALKFFLPSYEFIDGEWVLYSNLRQQLTFNPIVKPSEALLSALASHDNLCGISHRLGNMVQSYFYDLLHKNEDRPTVQESAILMIFFIAARNQHSKQPSPKKIAGLISKLWPYNKSPEKFRALKDTVLQIEEAIGSREDYDLRMSTILWRWAQHLVETQQEIEIVNILPIVNLIRAEQWTTDSNQGRFWSSRPDVRLKNISTDSLNYLIGTVDRSPIRGQIEEFDPLFWRSFIHTFVPTCDLFLRSPLKHRLDPTLLLQWMGHFIWNEPETFLASLTDFTNLTQPIGDRLRNNCSIDFTSGITAVLAALKRFGDLPVADASDWVVSLKTENFFNNIAWLTDLLLNISTDEGISGGLENDLAQVLRQWSSRPSRGRESEAEAWINILTRQQFKTQKINSIWNGILLENFRSQIDYQNFKILIDLIDTSVLNFPKELHEIFVNYLVKHLGDTAANEHILSKLLIGNLKAVLNDAIKQRWPSEFHEIESITKHLDFLLFCCKIDAKIALDSTIAMELDKVSAAVVGRISAIQVGSSSLSDVELVVDNQKEIAEFLTSTKVTEMFDVRETLKSLCTAKQEFDTLMNELNLLRECIDFRLLSRAEEYGPRIAELFKSAGSHMKVNSVFSWDSKQQFRVRNFGIVPDIKPVIRKLGDLRRNSFFRQNLNARVRRASESENFKLTDIPDFFNEIMDEIRPTVSTMIDGTISFDKIDQILGNLDEDYLENSFSEDFTQLTELLDEKKLDFTTALGKRKGQMKIYRQLKHGMGTTKVMMEFLEKNGATEAFKELDEIQKLVAGYLNDSPEVRSISVEYFRVAEKACNLTPEQLESIRAYMKSEKLVEWVKTTIKYGELDSFVEMASTNVGESSEQIAMVTDFGTAVSAYSPLMYELDGPLARKPLRDVMDVLNQVWRSLSQNISKKLDESCLNLPKIQNLKEATFSVQTSSIDTVQAINRTGVFRIGFFSSQTQNVDHSDASSMFDLKYQIIPPDVIKKMEQKLSDPNWESISSPTSPTSPTEQDWSHLQQTRLDLRKLTDLHSRLMLIGGRLDSKGSIKKEIDRFSQIYFSIRRLLNLLLEHQATGNIFFNQWQCTFYCCATPGVGWNTGKKARLLLYPGGDYFEISNPETSDRAENTQWQIDELCNFLERAQEEWNRHVQVARTNHTFLNYYTNRQIVRLRQSLAKLVTDESYELETEMLLMRLNEKVDRDMIVDALRAYDTTKSGAKEEDRTNSALSPEEEKQKQAIDFLTGNYVDKEIAYRAVAEMTAEGIDDEDQILELALELAETGVTAELPAPSLAESLARIQALGEDDSTGIERLDAKWSQHLKEETMGGYREFIGIEQLGVALQEIGMSSSHQTSKNGDLHLPIWITPNKPNLMVVKECDVIRYCLTLYESDLDQIHSSRVLVCHSHTSAEEFSLFIERMKYAEEKAVYAILYIEKLSSKLSLLVESLLEKLQHERKQCFGLGIFCSEEGFDGCHLAGILARHRQNRPRAISVCDARKLIHESVSFRALDSKPETEAVSEHFRAFLSTSVGYGHGKSLAISRQQMSSNVETLKMPIHDLSLDYDTVLESLLSKMNSARKPSRMIHLDIIDHRTNGIDEFLFELIILKSFSSPNGKVWHQLKDDRFAVEITSKASAFLALEEKENFRQEPASLPFKYYLPVIQCQSPYRALELCRQSFIGNPEIFHRLIDQDFCSDEAETCFQYLTLLQQNQKIPDEFAYDKAAGNDPVDVLQSLCQKCGIPNPSWTELDHFKNFLASQLDACERSSFCNFGGINGLKDFSVRFMTKMTEDFSTRSLKISEHAVSLSTGDEALQNIQALAEKRSWETKPHPYLFFNADMESISFFGCVFQRAGNSYQLIAEGTREVIMTADRGLIDLLSANIHQIDKCQVNEFTSSFDKKTRGEKLYKLYRVLLKDANKFLPHTFEELKELRDPDTNYELTLDCTLKMLAIEMRFRCGTPVIVMGDTGCGKTKLIEFLCGLKKMGVVQRMRINPSQIQNLQILKVHGGITAEAIQQKVRKARALAAENYRKFGLETILFFDEANTTSSISLIKELMIDGTMNGENIFEGNWRKVPLKFIAAVNPYRRHDKSAIQKANNAGLQHHFEDLEAISNRGGYRENNFFSSQSGSDPIPIRELVYRVHPLPPSMIPLVWDFGTLTSDVEDVYISQMVSRFASTSDVGQSDYFDDENISHVLQNMQRFMKSLESEASFVSLRDLQRSLNVMEWFFGQKGEDTTQLHQLIDQKSGTHIIPEEYYMLRSLILALCVCYRTSLQSKMLRRGFDRELSTVLNGQGFGAIDISREISSCQDVFLTELELESEIAKNEALKENVFMMIICCQLRIPLFLVGKPGSSKSLAKTLVTKAMRGRCSRGRVFRALTQATVVSFQCSLLADADGVQSVFRQCAISQKDKSRDDVTAIALFDEIGLAEYSPLMPLKALHSLLEDGVEMDETNASDEDDDENYRRPAFFGISNWSLDPAKMNRGICVSRISPDQEQLEETARSICHKDEASSHYDKVKDLIKPLTEAYLELYNSQKDYEFYGLRDFYSTMKMIYNLAARPSSEHMSGTPSYREVMKIVHHNFGGQRDPTQGSVGVFMKKIQHFFATAETRSIRESKPKILSLIRENLTTKVENRLANNRYLLVLTENYAATRLLTKLPELKDAVVIFGSAFKSDLEYTQICKTINTIRLCMDTGRTIVLLNLETVYESLYDLLNQAFMWFGDKRYVDIGLGSCRMKSHVHQNFRLIIVAEEEDVRQKFPAALINRMEKHFVDMETDMNEEELDVVEQLDGWVSKIAQLEPRKLSQWNAQARQKKNFLPIDSFIGYNRDTAAAVVSDLMERNMEGSCVYEQAKIRMLFTATPEGVLKISKSSASDEYQWCFDEYFSRQVHKNLPSFMEWWIEQGKTLGGTVQISTHADSLLATEDAVAFSRSEIMDEFQIHILTLQDYYTENQFETVLRRIIQAKGKSQMVILQCRAAERDTKLVACIRHKIDELLKENDANDCTVWVAFILFFNRVAFQLGDFMRRWLSDGTENVKQLSTPYRILNDSDKEQLAKSSKIDQEDLHIMAENADFEITIRKAQLRAKEESINRCQIIVATCESSEQKGSFNGQTQRKSAYELKSEFNKRFMELNAKCRQNLRLLILITAPRISSFPGAEWISFHLDDLTTLPEDIQDLKALRNKTLEQIINDESSVNWQNLIERTLPEVSQIISGNAEDHLERLAATINLCAGFKNLIWKTLMAISAEKRSRILNSHQNWLEAEALDRKSILDNQTFRNSLRRKIESTVAHLLAGVISYIDDSDNLELLREDGEDREIIWKLWMRIFGTPECLEDLKFNSPLFVTENSEGIPEINKGFSHRQSLPVSAKFPFSWKLIQTIDSSLETFIATSDISTPTIEEYRQMLYSTSWGAIVREELEQTAVGRRALFPRYLHDFVHFKVATHSEAVFMLVQDWIANLEETIRGVTKSSIPWPVAIHLAYKLISPHVDAFRDICSVLPNIEPILGTDLVKRLLQKTNFQVDIVAAELCVENLSQAIYPNKASELRSLVLNSESTALKCVEPGLQLSEFEFSHIRESRKDWIEFHELVAPVMCAVMNEPTAELPFGKELENVIQPHRMRRVHFLLRSERTAETKKNCSSQSLKVRWDNMSHAALFLKHNLTVQFQFKLAPLMQLLEKDLPMEEFLQELRKKFRNLWGRVSFTFYFQKGKPIYSLCGRNAGKPNLLECLHVLHDDCLEDIRHGAAVCPEKNCQKPITPDFVNGALQKLEKKKEQYHTCRVSMRNFFLDFVAATVFKGNAPPTLAVFEEILSIISPEANTTSDLSPFPDEDALDKSPILRSFVLQQLLQYKYMEVCDLLELFFVNSMNFTPTKELKAQFKWMAIQCFEDMLSQKLLSESNRAKMNALKEYIMRPLKGSQPLECLNTAARRLWMYSLMNLAVESIRDGSTEEFLAAEMGFAQKLIEESSDSSDMKFFPVKYLYHKYGAKPMTKIINHRAFRWLHQKLGIQDQNQSPDLYALFGKDYTDLRQSAMLESEDQTTDPDPVFEALTAYHLSTDQNVSKETKQRLQEKARTFLGHQTTLELCTASYEALNEPFHEIAPDVQKFGLALVLTLDGQRSQALTRFLWTILDNPRALERSFFPAMPEDHALEDYRAVRATEANSSLNRCPRGHLYIIGDCGRPSDQTGGMGKCHCGEMIGAQGYHQLADGNTTANNVREEHGYTYDQPQEGLMKTGERSLSRLNLVIVKTLLDITMLQAASTHPMEVSALICNARIGKDEVLDFINEHVEADLEAMCAITNRSRTECLSLMYYFLVRLKDITSNETASTFNPVLQDPDSRALWEQRFVATMELPRGDLSQIWTSIQETLGNDPGVNGHLWQKIYECNRGSTDSLCWQYRQPTTLGALMSHGLNQIDSLDEDSRRDTAILRMFFESATQLSALKYLPCIIKLQQKICNHYCGHVPMSEKAAQSTSIEDFISQEIQDGSKREISNLVEAFFRALDQVKDLIENASFHLGVGKDRPAIAVRIPPTIEWQYPLRNRLITILPVPVWKESLPGIALPIYLAELQSDFVAQSRRLANFENQESIPTAPLTSVNVEQLIRFDLQSDLYPLLLLHRNLELDVSHSSMSANFDLASLQRHVASTLIRRPFLIDPKVPPMLKSQEEILLESREMIQTKMEQRGISSFQRKELIDSCDGQLNQIRSCLEYTEKVIRFSSSRGSIEDDVPLNDSKNMALKGLACPKQLAKGFLLNQVIAVWNTLKCEEKILNYHANLDLFPEVPSLFDQQHLDPQKATVFRNWTETVDINQFLIQLTQFIVLDIPRYVRTLPEDTLNLQFNYSLKFFVADSDPEAERGFEKFPDEVELKEAVAVWKIGAELVRRHEF